MLPFRSKLQRATSGDQSLFLSSPRKANENQQLPLSLSWWKQNSLRRTCVLLSVPSPPGSVPHGPCQGGRDQGERRENSCPAVGPNTVEISPGELGDLQGQIRWKRENRALRKIRNFAQDSREGCEGTNIAFGGHLWQLSIFFLFLPVFFLKH